MELWADGIVLDRAEQRPQPSATKTEGEPLVPGAVTHPESL